MVEAFARMFLKATIIRTRLVSSFKPTAVASQHAKEHLINTGMDDVIICDVPVLPLIRSLKNGNQWKVLPGLAGEKGSRKKFKLEKYLLRKVIFSCRYGVRHVQCDIILYSRRMCMTDDEAE